MGSYALVTRCQVRGVGTYTIAAGIESVRRIFLPLAAATASRTIGIVRVMVTCLLLACVAMVIVGSAIRWWGLTRASRGEALASP